MVVFEFSKTSPRLYSDPQGYFALKLVCVARLHLYLNPARFSMCTGEKARRESGTMLTCSNHPLLPLQWHLLCFLCLRMPRQYLTFKRNSNHSRRRFNSCNQEKSSAQARCVPSSRATSPSARAVLTSYNSNNFSSLKIFSHLTPLLAISVASRKRPSENSSVIKISSALGRPNQPAMALSALEHEQRSCAYAAELLHRP